MNKPLDEAVLVALLKEQWESADTYYNSEIADEQEAAIDYYEGRPFGDEIDGRSQIVLPDVQDAVDHMTIQVVKPFVSGDRVVEFEARNEQDAEFVDDALEAVSQTFMRGQHGFRVIHDWAKAGLKENFCALKSTVAFEAKVVQQKMLADAEQLAMADEETAATAVDNGDGTFTVTTKQEIRQPKFYDYTVPSEEYRHTRRARSEDDCEYQAHACRKTRSDLVLMGFDRDTVYGLPVGDEDLVTDGRGHARDKDVYLGGDNSNASMQEVLLIEEYIRVDADGDAVAELLQCFRVGTTLLSAEIVEEQPFTVFTPYPEPHRMTGKGLAHKTMVSQRIRSVVARQMLDGMYQHNSPRWWVPAESTTNETLDDLLEPVGPVRGKGAAPVLLSAQYDVSKSLGVIEFFTRERSYRTGQTDINQGVAPDMLNTTATGASIQDERGAQTADFIIRVFAESLSRVFLKKYKLIKAYGEPFHIKVDGQYKLTDPSQWPDEVDVLIRTGLGTGKKDARIANRLQILQVQREGFELGMVKPDHLFKSAAGLIKDMGLGQPDDYFVDPANADPAQQQEQQPDPALLELQAKAQLDQQKLQGEQAIAQQRMDLMRGESELKLSLARAEAEEKAALARERAEFEAQMAQEQADREYALALQQAARNAEIADRKVDAIPTNRPGGDLDK
jgi:hypothetical protein